MTIVGEHFAPGEDSQVAVMGRHLVRSPMMAMKGERTEMTSTTQMMTRWIPSMASRRRE